MYVIAMNMICVGCGACKDKCETIGAYIAMGLFLVHITVLIFTAYFRFNGMG